jgi:hypothetical protein
LNYGITVNYGDMISYVSLLLSAPRRHDDVRAVLPRLPKRYHESHRRRISQQSGVLQLSSIDARGVVARARDGRPR